MNLSRSLLDIARLLLSEDDDNRAPELLLRKVVEATRADRGFIVVAEAGSYVEKSAVRFDRAALSADERRWSRTAVRRSIETKAIVRLSAAGAEDEDIALRRSLEAAGATQVIAAPLVHAGDVYGVLYLEYSSSREVGRSLPREVGRSLPREVGRSLPREVGRSLPRDDDDGGVTAFLTELTELAGLCLKRAIERETLRRENRSLAHDTLSRHDFRGIVTRDRRMLDLLQMVAQIADSEATVLIVGETGTGKELIARALHANSPRRDKPCVTLHTTALPGTILESELFGHVKGAFTGADRDRTGRLAAAHGGTLFLDEVAEIAPEVQAKLLRFLQFGEVQRVGSDRVEKVDVRVLSATHQNLASLVETGKFRRDLYYRLKVIEVRLPALRERRADIPLLIEHFLQASWKRPGPRPHWTAEARAILERHDYPGNVRELGHAVERAVVLARSPELGADLLPPDMAPQISAAAPAAEPAPRFEALTNDALERAREAAVAAVERTFVTALLRANDDNVSAAARHAGMNRTYLQKLLARHRKGEGEGEP